MKKAILIITAILMMCSTGSAEVIIIVNNAVPVYQISQSDASKIFLGKKTSWDDGTEISVGVLRSGAVHDDFLKQIVKKTSSQFDTYWKRMIFTGSGQSPSTYDSEAEIVQFVGAVRGAVGYIDSATPHSNVKTVDIR